MTVGFALDAGAVRRLDPLDEVLQCIGGQGEATLDESIAHAVLSGCSLLLSGPGGHRHRVTRGLARRIRLALIGAGCNCSAVYNGDHQHSRDQSHGLTCSLITRDIQEGPTSSRAGSAHWSRSRWDG